VDDRKNLPEHETLIRRYCATTQEPKSKFTEKMLLYPMDPHRTSNNLGGVSELFQSR
jgi:hypothetical protein